MFHIFDFNLSLIVLGSMLGASHQSLDPTALQTPSKPAHTTDSRNEGSATGSSIAKRFMSSTEIWLDSCSNDNNAYQEEEA